MTPAQSALVVDNIKLAHAIAWEWYRKLPSFNASDLDDEALFGLCNAAIAFKSARGVPFSAYARIRINGAIRDFLRIQQFFVSGVGRHKSRPDIKTITLDTWVDRVEAKRCSRPDRNDGVRDIMKRLPNRERRVVLLRATGYTFDEIGAKLGVTRTRAHQLKISAMERLNRSNNRD